MAPICQVRANIPWDQEACRLSCPAPGTARKRGAGGFGVLRNEKNIWGNIGKFMENPLLFMYIYISILKVCLFFSEEFYLRKSLNYWVIVSSHGTDDQVWGDLVCFVFFVLFFRGEIMFNLHLSCFGCEWPYYARYASFLFFLTFLCEIPHTMFIVNGCHDFLGEMPLLVESLGNLASHHTNLELVLAQETNIPIVVLQRPKKHQWLTSS